MKKDLELKVYELIRLKGIRQEDLAKAINESLPRLNTALKNKAILKKALLYLQTIPDKEWRYEGKRISQKRTASINRWW